MRGIKRQILAIAGQGLETGLMGPAIVAGFGEHFFGEVKADDFNVRMSVQNSPRELSRSAADVQHARVRSQVERFQNRVVRRITAAAGECLQFDASVLSNIYHRQEDL